MPQKLTTLQQIQGLYQTLNSADRRALRLFIDNFKGAKRSTGVAPKAADSQARDWLLTGILTELARRGMPYASRNAHAVAGLASNYEEDAAFVRAELLLKLGAQGIKYVELLQLGNVVARALADYINSWGSVHLGLKVMLRNVNKSMEALDASYPGYLKCGMLDQLFRTKTKTK